MKIRFCSFLFFTVLLFIFLTAIPGRLWQQSAKFAPSEAKTLELDMERAESPYQVIVNQTQIFPSNIPNEENYSASPSLQSGSSDSEEAQSSLSNPAQTTNAPSVATPSTASQSATAPATTNPSTTNPSASTRMTSVPETRESSLNNPGSYPESHFLDAVPHGDSANDENNEVPSDRTSSSNASSSPDSLPQSNGQSIPADSSSSNSDESPNVSRVETSSENHELDVFQVSAQVEAFLNESPMVQKDQETANPFFRKVSRRGGFDVIPERSGINGRSIYGPREHFIEDGDTLPKLASRYLGNPNRENEIFEMNRDVLSDKEELPIGRILRIPEKF